MPTTRAKDTCPACEGPKGVARAQCKACNDMPLVERCVCGNAFTPWFSRNGLHSARRRLTCGLCYSRTRRTVGPRLPTGRFEKQCPCCQNHFLGLRNERYCGVACMRRFTHFLKRLAKRLRYRSSRQIPYDVVVMSWALSGLHRAIQGANEPHSRERFPMRPQA